MSSIPTRTNPFAKIESFDDFKPKPVTQEHEPKDSAQVIAKAEQKAKLTKLAKEEGCKSSNFDENPIPARIPIEAKTFLKTVRIHVSDWNRFQLWCHENSYTHRKGFQVLTSSLAPKND